MAVTNTVSTDGKFKTFSDANATLTSAMGTVLAELEDHNISKTQTDTHLTFDSNTNKYVFVAVCRTG